MPTQKDLKRLVRARMGKTGESYTAARLQLVKKSEPAPNYAELAGMSDDSLSKRTGRTWAEWVRLLDAEHSAKKPHAEIASYILSLGTPDWWSQTVTVGYERIKGLRARGQRRGGGYETTKARTFALPIETLYAAVANGRTRKKWLTMEHKVRSSTVNKRVTLDVPDGTVLLFNFMPKGSGKSIITVTHQKLPDKASADASKKEWAAAFDRLSEIITKPAR